MAPMKHILLAALIRFAPTDARTLRGLSFLHAEPHVQNKDPALEAVEAKIQMERTILESLENQRQALKAKDDKMKSQPLEDKHEAVANVTKAMGNTTAKAVTTVAKNVTGAAPDTETAVTLAAKGVQGSDPVEDTGEAIANGTKELGKLLWAPYYYAGEALANAAVDTGKAISNGTKKVVPTTEDTGEAISNGTKKLGKTLWKPFEEFEKKDKELTKSDENENGAEVKPAAEPTADPLGNDVCKCIGVVLNGTFPVKVGFNNMEYPAKTGSSCAAWDDKIYPGCREGEPEADWCKKKWCYVDPCTCGLKVPPKKSLTSNKWQGKPLYWSYATCGDTDTFSAGNEKACVNQNFKTGCEGLDGCAWDGKQCLGKDLVEACAVNDELDEAVYGKKTCRCIGQYPKEGTVQVKMGKQTHEFPGSLGGHCAAWIDGVFETCKGMHPPLWCKQKWCYVDPCSCDLEGSVYSKPRKSATAVTYQGKPVYWSFETCGGGSIREYYPGMSVPEFPPAYCPKTTPPPPTAAPKDVLKKMDEKFGLPAQGYDEVSGVNPVAHDDGKTATEDFGKEWPQTDESPHESYERICKDYPNSKWCKMFNKSREKPKEESSIWGSAFGASL